LAERRIGASDDCNPISTAGYETSGTINMKFMKFIMNGALRVGTPDGATIETAAEAGEGNLFLFGLTRDQVAGTRSWYNPRWHYDNETETREAPDLVFSNYFSPNGSGVFEPLREALPDRR
jgi:starch phosphorylase